MAQSSESNRPHLTASIDIVRDNLGEGSGRLVLAVALATASVVCELLPIWFTFDLIRNLVAGTAQSGDFYRYALVLLLVIPLGYGLFGLATTNSHVVAFKLIHRLRRKLAAHLTQLPLGYFSNQRSGAVRKMMIDEPEKLELAVAHAIPEGASAFFMWLAVSAWLFWMDWMMALATIFLTPVSFVLMSINIRGNMGSMVHFQDTNARMNGAIGEFLAGIATIKVFRRAGRSQDDAAKAIREMAAAQSAWGRAYVPLGGAFYAMVLANITLILPVGLWSFWAGRIDLPTLLFFVILGGNYSTPLMRLFNLFHQFASISMAATTLQGTLNLDPQTDTGAQQALPHHDISFDKVSFAYDDTPVLHDISFTAGTGQTTALVGPSGSGKSTVANLIARFHDLPEGAIRIGGVDISQMGRAQLMQTVGFVFQDTFLFSGTIAENLRFARPDASDAELHAAARAAHAHDFITALPDGYDTVIGDGSGALSGGERQRIAIARTILKDAPVIVLDEATAFADPDSETEIQKAISALARGKTLVVVAHRLHTIAHADQILVLDRGHLVQQGTHQELLDMGGLYARMWRDYMAARTQTLRPATAQLEAGQ